MSFKLEEMINAWNKDYSRGYTFYFIPPAALGEDTKFLCKSTALPADTITVAEADWQGNKYKVATTHEYGDLTVSFLVDPTDTLRWRLSNWSNQIHSRVDNLHGTPAGYMEDFYLEHISHYNGDPIMTYKIKMGWPSSVGELSLDYSSKDLATFDVTFTYQWFETS